LTVLRAEVYDLARISASVSRQCREAGGSLFEEK
jgi:hypothetical protein